MPFSTIGDRRKGGVVDGALQLRSDKVVAISATASEPAVQFPILKHTDCRVMISHAAITAVVPGTAEWRISIETSDTSGGTFTPVETISLGATGAIRSLLLDSGNLAIATPTAQWVRITATKVGTPGNLSYGAWITN